MPTKEQQRSYTETDLDHVTDWDYVIENNGTPVDFSNEIFKFLKNKLLIHNVYFPFGIIIYNTIHISYITYAFALVIRNIQQL